MIDFILGSPSIHPQQQAQADLKLGKLLGNNLIHLDLIVLSFFVERVSVKYLGVAPSC